MPPLRLPIFSGAQYHTDPYTFTAADMSGAAGLVDRIFYSFAYFCPATDDGRSAAASRGGARCYGHLSSVARS